MWIPIDRPDDASEVVVNFFQTYRPLTLSAWAEGAATAARMAKARNFVIDTMLIDKGRDAVLDMNETGIEK